MIPKILSGVKVRREEFGALIFTNRTPVLALNQDAFAVWQMIDGSRSVADIVQELTVSLVDETEMSRTVNKFIVSCTDLGLIEVK